MKCIRCEHDSKYSERGGGRCPKCNGEFAFEPKRGAMFTDMAFKRAIDAVSVNGTVRWGVEHLYYEACRRKRRMSAWGCAIVALVLCAICVIGATQRGTKNPPVLILIGGAALFVAVLAYIVHKDARFVSMDLSKFNAIWSRWREVHGVPEGLIVRQAKAAPRTIESDIGDYSFDRAVICDRARTVDLLLANNFHFENNCAVLSIEGYPPGPFETVRRMLKRNPRLQVFALHDCTPSGCMLAHKLNSDPSWFAGGVRAVDIGLRPSQTKRFKGLLLKSTAGQVPAVHGISPEEADWLANHALELAAIRPEQVLKRLFRAVNRQPGDLDSDATDTEGSYDSFG